MSRDQEGMQMHFDNQIFEYQRSKKIKLKLISVKVLNLFLKLYKFSELLKFLLDYSWMLNYFGEI